MTSPAMINLGVWQLEVANIVWTNGVPSLANIRTLNPVPNSFYEPYGFSPDDQDVVFATSAGGGVAHDTIDEINVNGTGLTQLSPTMPSGIANYAEFAFYTPSNNSIIWGRGYDTAVAGMDYWTMNPDGTNPQRLTYFNEPWHTEYLGYSVTGGLAFNPNNPNQFLAGVAVGIAAQNTNAVMVTLNPSASQGEMTEQVYSDQALQNLVQTTTQSLSNGFKSPGAPAPGAGTTNYSIRWSGTVTPPATGNYSLCIAADINAQLFVGGVELVAANFSYGKRVCGTVSATAGVPLSVVVDYEHDGGGGYAQLSWITPGASAATVIPSTALAPSSPGTVVPVAGPGSTPRSSKVGTKTATTVAGTSGTTSTTARAVTVSTGTTGTTGRTGTTRTTGTGATARTTKATGHKAQQAKRKARLRNARRRAARRSAKA
jgi:hypothetical protein